MAKAPRPTDDKMLKPWALKEFPNDPIRQKRAIDAGLKANAAARQSAERNKQYQQMKQNNRLGRGKKG